MIIIKPGSHAYRIVKLLLYTGEFPYYSLGMLGNVRMMKNVVNRMAESHEVRNDSGKTIFQGKILNISGKGQFKTIRLNAYAFKIIDALFPDLMEYYRILTGNHRFRGDSLNVERHHRVAESVCMLLLAGIEMHPDKVPQLQMDETNKKSFQYPAFYHSRILKTLIKDEMKKTQFTRTVGAVFTQDICYAVYNTRNAAMKWSGAGEIKARDSLEMVATMNSYASSPDSMFLMGKNFDVIVKTMRLLDKDPKEKIIFGHIYRYIHFIPMNEFGVKLLQLYSTPCWKEFTLGLLFDTSMIRREMGAFKYDAKEDDSYFVSFLDSDIVKLRSVLKYLEKNKADVTVICFEDQTDFIQSFMGSCVTIHPIKIDEILDALKIKRRNCL